MPDPTSRLLSLLSLLQTARSWSGGELAERLGVTRRTVRRDVERLRHLGYEVEAAQGPTGGYRLAAGRTLPPLLFQDDEGLAIAIGLRVAAKLALADIDDASVSALAVQQVLPPRLRRRVRSCRRPRRSGRPGTGRPWTPTSDHGWAGCRAPRTGPPDLLRARRPRPTSARRASAARGREPPVVPGRLRPGPGRLAHLPSRPDQLTDPDRLAGGASQGTDVQPPGLPRRRAQLAPTYRADVSLLRCGRPGRCSPSRSRQHAHRGERRTLPVGEPLRHARLADAVDPAAGL